MNYWTVPVIVMDAGIIRVTIEGKDVFFAHPQLIKFAGQQIHFLQRNDTGERFAYKGMGEFSPEDLICPLGTPISPLFVRGYALQSPTEDFNEH